MVSDLCRNSLCDFASLKLEHFLLSSSYLPGVKVCIFDLHLHLFFDFVCIQFCLMLYLNACEGEVDLPHL